MLVCALIFSIAIHAGEVIAQAAPPDGTRFVITDFGALGNGTTLNTEVIQKTIDHAADLGGGTVVIPKGVFLSGAVFLKPLVNLHIDKDGVLKGTSNIADYPKLRTRVEGHFQVWLPALLNATGIDHLKISGDGTLDGSGKPFWDEFRQRRRANPKTTNLDVERPRLICIQNCDDLNVGGLHLKDSGFWNLHIYHCNNVLVDGLNIQAPQGAPSTDGMDIDSTQNITIRNCYIAVSDDCIALKGSKGPLALEDKDSPPVEHVHVTDCTFAQGGGMVTLGSEATIIRDVLVENCKIAGPGTRGISLVRLKLRPDTPQTYEDIHFNNITLDGAGRFLSIEPWKQYFDLQGHAPPTETVRNVTVSNISGTFGSFGVIHGNPGNVIENITLENVDITLTNPKPQLVGIKNLIISNVKINGKDFTAADIPTTRPAN
ncbi:MAG: glycosyl hydrolase family 28 protein [Planctomycetota bacterium]|nr:glycosyl hydrolase family 28 protein [Planctomycetota bacterium]